MKDELFRLNRLSIVGMTSLSLLLCVCSGVASAVGNDGDGQRALEARGYENAVDLQFDTTTTSMAPGAQASSSGGSSSSGEYDAKRYGPPSAICPFGTERISESFLTGESTNSLAVCLDEPVVASAPEYVVVRGSDVASLIVDGSGAWRQPPGPQTRIDMPVIAYSSGDSVTLTTTVAGIGVTVVATPVSYRWDWGDGTSTTTTDPGAPYPDHTVSHDYRRTQKDVVITVTTTWEASFTPDGGETQAVSGVITTTSSATPFDLVRTVTYLTDDAEEAQGR